MNRGIIVERDFKMTIGTPSMRGARWRSILIVFIVWESFFPTSSLFAQSISVPTPEVASDNGQLLSQSKAMRLLDRRRETRRQPESEVAWAELCREQALQGLPQEARISCSRAAKFAGAGGRWGLFSWQTYLAFGHVHLGDDAFEKALSAYIFAMGFGGPFDSSGSVPEFLSREIVSIASKRQSQAAIEQLPKRLESVGEMLALSSELSIHVFNHDLEGATRFLEANGGKVSRLIDTLVPDGRLSPEMGLVCSLLQQTQSSHQIFGVDSAFDNEAWLALSDCIAAGFSEFEPSHNYLQILAMKTALNRPGFSGGSKL